MNWNQVEDNWGELKGQMMDQWGDFTETDLNEIDGQQQQLIELLQETYGISHAEAVEEVSEFLAGLEPAVRVEAEY